MSYKVRTKLCKECGQPFSYTFPKEFCTSSCAARYNNRIRKQSGWKRSKESLAKTAESMKRYYQEHPERYRKDGKGAWYLNDVARAKMRKRYDERPKKLSGISLDVSYGDFVKYKNSHPVCEICGRREYVSTGGKKPNSLAIDHQHGTNHFRGLLCQQCNTKLGWFEKNKESVLAYLSERNLSRGDA